MLPFLLIAVPVFALVALLTAPKDSDESKPVKVELKPRKTVPSRVTNIFHAAPPKKRKPKPEPKPEEEEEPEEPEEDSDEEPEETDEEPVKKAKTK